MVSRITDLAQYKCALARRELLAAPLRDADKLPPGALPARVRSDLQVLLEQVDAQIRQYEHDLDEALRFGLQR